MPTYEYICTHCQGAMEAFQKMSDEPLKVCPSCKKESLQRRPGGGIGLLFKGSGFYHTDYGPAKGASQEAPASGSSNSCCPCGKNKCS